MAEVQYLERLVAARQRAWNEGKELLELADKEGRDLSAEEREKWDRINADLDSKAEEIASIRERYAVERENDVISEARAAAAPRMSENRQVETTSQPDVNAWIRGEAGSEFTLNIASAAYVKNQVRAGADAREVRDLLVGTTTAGGFTVPTTLETQLYDFLEVYSGMRRSGATVITTSSGETIDWPKVTAHGTAAVLGEGTASAEADPAFGKVTLTPYKYSQLLQISEELLTDTVVDLTGFIAKDMGRAIARVTDTAYVLGSGTNAPKGALIPMGTGATVTAVATGQPQYNDLIDLQYSVNEEYRANGAVWMMKDATAGALRKVKDTTGRPLWEPSAFAGITGARPDMLLGHGVVTDPNYGSIGTAASTIIAFGDFGSYYIIRDVGGVVLKRSDDFAFSSGLATYRTTFRTAADAIDLTGACKKMIEPTT
jgi:HK97 family phage major capsid protein